VGSVAFCFGVTALNIVLIVTGISSTPVYTGFVAILAMAGGMYCAYNAGKIVELNNQSAYSKNGEV